MKAVKFIMNRYLRCFKQYADYSKRAMGSGDHFKNGASLKNPTNKGKSTFRPFGIVVFIVVMFLSINNVVAQDGSEELVAAARGYFETGNYTRAMSLYLKAAEKGNASAMCGIGAIYYVNKNFEESYSWYLKAAEKGNENAMSAVGRFYYYGQGVRKDTDKAVEWFKKAADTGSISAMYDLGTIYLSEENFEESYNWYLNAAEKGNEDAMYALGMLYYNGDGVKKDTDKAVEWFKKAADSGNDNAKKILRRIDGEVDIEMALVKGGSFTMGCDNLGIAGASRDPLNKDDPSHRVTVDAFYIGKYEVTQAQWVTVMGSNPSRYKGDDLPVEQVTWEQVQEFIRKLNEKTGKNYRLPTEAEWEYAARGGHDGGACQYSGVRPKGYVPGKYELRDAYCAEIHQCACCRGETCPVGSLWPNELGIYDMSGNVVEWCSDWYAKFSVRAAVNPQGPESGTERIIRGGDFKASYIIRSCIHYRMHNYPDYLDGGLGFRLAHGVKGFARENSH